MKSYDLDLKSELFGPNGGDLEGSHNPEARRASHTSIPLPDGSPGLHRLKHRDVAIQGIEKEQPWHLMAAVMLASGVSNVEVARAAGVTEGYISVLKAQRWFQERLAYETNRIAIPLQDRFEAEANAAFDRLKEISQATPCDEVKASTILAANLAIIEHAKGKPVQSVQSVVKTVHYSSPAEEMADLQSQLSALQNRREASVIPISSPSSSVLDPVVELEPVNPTIPSASPDGSTAKP